MLKPNAMSKPGVMLLWALVQIISPIPAHSLEDISLLLEEEVILYMDEIKTFNVNTPSRVTIGNPLIADIASVTDSAIVLAPKAQGTTIFVYKDLFGEHSFRLHVLSENLSDYLSQIESVLKELNQPNVYTRLVDTKDKILLKGKVKTQNDKEMIFTALGSLKSKVTDLVEVVEEDATVDIEVEVLEADTGLTKTLGFTMPTTAQYTEVSGKYSTKLRDTADAIFRVFDWRRTPGFQASIQAAIDEGRARVLSRPRLACQSGKEADLVVGGEKPIFSTQIAALGATGTSVTYKEYGIKLKIKPTVKDNDRIMVSLEVEVSEVGDAETIGGAGGTTAKAYPIEKRNASTELFLENAQTLAIAGLIKKKDETASAKVAFLGDIPILGMLFRHKTTKLGGGQLGDKELIIFLTPKIIRQQEGLASTGSKVSAPRAILNSDIGNRKIHNEPQDQEPKRQSSSPDSYADTVQEHVLSNVKYPPFIKGSGIGGMVKLTLRLASSGELLDARVKESSGYQVLDDYAVSTVKEIHSFPAFPSSMNSKELFIDIPIVYNPN